MHRQPTETQAESSTAAATHPNRTSTASNNTQGTNWDTSWIQYCCTNSPQQDHYCQQKYTGNQLGHKLNPVLLHQLTPATPPLSATIHREPTETQAEWNSPQQDLNCHQQYTGNQLGHKLNPVLLHQLTPARPLLSATIHREPTETQAECSTAAATHPSRTSTANNNTQGTNWEPRNKIHCQWWTTTLQVTAISRSKTQWVRVVAGCPSHVCVKHMLYHLSD